MLCMLSLDYFIFGHKLWSFCIFPYFIFAKFSSVYFLMNTVVMEWERTWPMEEWSGNRQKNVVKASPLHKHTNQKDTISILIENNWLQFENVCYVDRCHNQSHVFDTFEVDLMFCVFVCVYSILNRHSTQIFAMSSTYTMRTVQRQHQLLSFRYKQNNFNWYVCVCVRVA